MSDFSAFTQIQPTLAAIPERDVQLPNMPVEIASQEAEVMLTAAREDFAALTSVGLEAGVLDSLAQAIAALRHANAHYVASLGELRDAEKEWRKQKPVAFNLRRKLLAALTFATRDVADASESIKRIRQGKTRVHMIHHLIALAQLGEKYPAACDAIHLEEKELQDAKSLAEVLCGIEAKATTESSSSKSKEWRDRAFTHMRNIQKKVIPAAEYAFLDNTARLEFYRSAYRRRVYHRVAVKKAANIAETAK
jgi:hypothetical protein